MFPEICDLLSSVRREWAESQHCSVDSDLCLLVWLEVTQAGTRREVLIWGLFGHLLSLGLLGLTDCVFMKHHTCFVGTLCSSSQVLSQDRWRCCYHLRAYHVCAISVHDIPSWEMLMRASGLSLWFPFTLAVSSNLLRPNQWQNMTLLLIKLNYLEFAEVILKLDFQHLWQSEHVFWWSRC